jgi:hypothetical protein
LKNNGLNMALAWVFSGFPPESIAVLPGREKHSSRLISDKFDFEDICDLCARVAETHKDAIREETDLAIARLAEGF